MDTSNMSLMEIFSNPDTMHSLSFGAKMQASLITMIMGLGITFMILILIWIFIAIMGKVMGLANKPKTAPAPAAAAAAPAAAAPAAAAPAESSDESLVAVIAAAVAAFEGANASNLVVKKITRLSGDQTPWGLSGLEDRLDTRKF